MESRYKGLAQELADLVTPCVDSPQWLSYGENRLAPLAENHADMGTKSPTRAELDTWLEMLGLVDKGNAINETNYIERPTTTAKLPGGSRSHREIRSQRRERPRQP